MQAPCRCTCNRSAIWWASRAGLRVRRVTWAVAGSGNEPNSARSPPLQNDGPLPVRCTAVMLSSAAASVSASDSPSRSDGRDGVVAVRPVQRDVQLVADALDEHRRRRVGRQRPVTARPSPRGELGAGLQRRVHRRLGGQPLLDGAHLARPQQHGERRRGDGVTLDLLDERAEHRVIGAEHHVVRRGVDGGHAGRRRRRRRRRTTTGTEPGDKPGGADPTVASTSEQRPPAEHGRRCRRSSAANSSPSSPGRRLGAPAITARSALRAPGAATGLGLEHPPQQLAGLVVRQLGADVDQRSARASSAGGRAPTRAARRRRPRRSRTIDAPMSSPHSCDGMAYTATSSTAACSRSTSSISPGEMFSPPRTMTSSRRPSRKRKPSASRNPPSRVANQSRRRCRARRTRPTPARRAPRSRRSRRSAPPRRTGRGSSARSPPTGARPSRAAPRTAGSSLATASRWSSGVSTAIVELVSVSP